ncbi:hypothetical protein LCGC14_1366190 [marine sediment metagenome]|uniref:Uncharacterized protein n=1 Tax=marine sediment metagenome TaxID=412755 RepID=A0A0F9MLW4_9ZZZZ
MGCGCGRSSVIKKGKTRSTSRATRRRLLKVPGKGPFKKKKKVST